MLTAANGAGWPTRLLVVETALDNYGGKKCKKKRKRRRKGVSGTYLTLFDNSKLKPIEQNDATACSLMMVDCV